MRWLRRKTNDMAFTAGKAYPVEREATDTMLVIADDGRPWILWLQDDGKIDSNAWEEISDE